MDLIDVVGLDEEIRCEMCRNPMHTDRGCDGNCKYDEKLYERIIQILDKRITPLPSAQPEPKTGEWILMSDADGEYYACSECGEELPYCSETPTWDKPYPRKQSIDKTDFCPNCGADMRQSNAD